MTAVDVEQLFKRYRRSTLTDLEYEELFNNRFLNENSTYIEVRDKHLHIVYKEHRSGDDVPLIFFIHGFSGMLENFSEQISYFSHSSNVLAVDLVGHGRSEISPNHSDYGTTIIVMDLFEIYTRYRNSNVILVGHSYGCCLALKLYHYIKKQDPALVSNHVVSMIMVCPGALPPSIRLTWPLFLPTWMVRRLRHHLRKAAKNPLYSPTINQLVYPDCDITLRRQIYLSSAYSDTSVMMQLGRRLVWTNKEDYDSVDIPMLVITGEDDQILPAREVQKIYEWSTPHCRDPVVIKKAGHMVQLEQSDLVNAVMSSFLINDVKLASLDSKSQLQRSSIDVNFEWTLKNEQKWKETEDVGKQVEGSRFYPMKILRDSDDTHSPGAFQSAYPDVGLVMDVSNAPSPYKTKDLNAYLKLAAQPKSVPTPAFVSHFLQIVDDFWKEHPTQSIAIHCHYGYNRTGFLICCYLIEVQKYSVQKALHAFSVARPDGIRHSYFRDELALRYEGSSIMVCREIDGLVQHISHPDIKKQQDFLTIPSKDTLNDLSHESDS